MRGKESACTPQSYQARITPAYAGKSDNFFLCFNFRGDHPRLCGEKRKISRSFSVLRGSPPPMRGKGTEHRQDYRQNRITPAYAGKSKSRQWEAFVKRDHPRLCGEKITMFLFSKNALGSPPPMRGKEDE